MSPLTSANDLWDIDVMYSYHCIETDDSDLNASSIAIHVNCVCSEH